MTQLLGYRKPTKQERERGAEIVFTREDDNGRSYEILAAKCYESWEQWGQPREILSDNVEDVEKWRNK